MKIIKKYILSEYFSSLSLGLAVFTFILLLNQIFQVINMIISKGVGVGDAFKLFALMLPNILSLSIPIASLYGGILSYGRLSADNEIMALKTVGVKHFHFMAPPVIFNLILAALLVFYNLYISPQTYKKFNETYFNLVQKKPTLKLEEKSIIEIANNKIYFEKKDIKGRLRNVSIYRFDDARGFTVPTMFIYADYADISVGDSNILFRLYNGIGHRIDMAAPSDMTSMKFNRYDISIPLVSSLSYTKSLREYNGSEIISEIKSYKDKGLPASIFETEYNLRIAIGLAPFFFIIIGVPLGLLAHRGTKSVGFGLSLAVVFVYYIFLAIGINFSDKNYIPSALALQIPNIATAITAVLLWRKALSR